MVTSYAEEFQVDHHKALATHDMKMASTDTKTMLSNNVRNAKHLASVIVYGMENQRARAGTELHRRSLCHEAVIFSSAVAPTPTSSPG